MFDRLFLHISGDIFSEKQVADDFQSKPDHFSSVIIFQLSFRCTAPQPVLLGWQLGYVATVDVALLPCKDVAGGKRVK